MTDETRNPQVAAEEAAIQEQAAPEMPGADQPSAAAQQAAADQPLPEEGAADQPLPEEGAAEDAPAESPADAGAPVEPTADASAPVEPTAGAGAPVQPATDAGPAAEPAPPVDKAAEYLALAQRTQADFENYRKRTARDAALAADRGMAKLAKELLPALDHLDLALRAAEEHGGGEFAKGIRQIQDEMVGALGRVGIQAYSPKGEQFDPSEHEAMASQPVEGAEPGTVAEVYQQGYRINGTVLRPARVVVAA